MVKKRSASAPVAAVVVKELFDRRDDAGRAVERRIAVDVDLLDR